MPVSVATERDPFRRAAQEGLSNPEGNPTDQRRPQGRPPEGSADWAPKVFGAMMQGASLTRACRVANIHISTLHYRRKKDEHFARALRESAELGTEFLEQEAARRAYHGTLKPVFHKGEQCGVVREYSDTLMIFLLKARKPDVYRDKVEQGKGAGVSVNVVQNNLEAAALIRGMIDDGQLGIVEADEPPDQSGAPGGGGLEREVEAGAAPEGDQQRTGEGVEDAE